MPPDTQTRATRIETQLARFLGARACLLGIGNRHRRDDGVGSRIAAGLGSQPGFAAVDGGVVPENHLEAVARLKPDTVLLIDAVEFGGEPGEARLLTPDDVSLAGVSTHAGSLHLLAEYLRARTHARVALLAIQPADVSDGDHLSDSVLQTAEALQEMLPLICGYARSTAL